MAGRKRYRYEGMMPCEKLKSLPDAEQYLKPNHLQATGCAGKQDERQGRGNGARQREKKSVPSHLGDNQEACERTEKSMRLLLPDRFKTGSETQALPHGVHSSHAGVFSWLFNARLTVE